MAQEYPAGCVVVGIGVNPDDLLARSAGLLCERGVIVDDCARTSIRRSPPPAIAPRAASATVELVRLESVQNAIEQGKSAAAALHGRIAAVPAPRPGSGPISSTSSCRWWD